MSGNPSVLTTRRNRASKALLAVVLAVAAVLSGLGQGRAAAAPARPSGPLVPATGALFGAYANHADVHIRSDFQDVVAVREAKMGRRYDILHHYHRFADTFPTWREAWNSANGRTSMISWRGENSTAINRGKFDSVIRARAQGVKALGEPIFIRYFWEMDGRANRDRAISPDAFVAAWRRIVNQFRSQGAGNAVFVWCPTAWGFESGAAGRYYPGDDYVDWGCADGYNWAPKRAGDAWRAAPEIYRAFHAWGLQRGKPMMIGEIGALERRTGEKAAWITGLGKALKDELSGIAALVYFDSLHRHPDGNNYDWRTVTSSSTWNAYKALARDPYFNVG